MSHDRFRLTRRRLLGAGAALGGTALAGPLLLGNAKAGTPGLVRFGLSSYPPGIAPWENKGTASNTVKLQLFRGLVGYDPDGQLRPELAESWQVPDAQTYIFKLRDNAAFHNGEPVTAADVKYSLEAIAAEDSTAHLRSRFGIVESIETPDDKTVQIRLKEPQVTFIYLVASVHALIVSAKGAEQDPDNPVGAGPYRIANVERGTSIELEAFDQYYRAERPRSQRLLFTAYKDENLRVAALEAGDVDIIEYVPWQSMDALGANDNVKLDVVDGPFMYLLFNCKSGPFSDPKLRRAVAHAIRREDIIAAAFFGRGNPLASLPIPPGSEFHQAKYDGHWAYDPERAKTLLQEAGHGDGFSATLLSTAQYGMHKDTAEIVQQHLAEIGIQVQLNLPDWGTRVSLGNRGQYDFAVMGSAGDFNDPDALTNFLDGSRGDSYVRSLGFIDEEINRLLAAGRQELDTEKRKDIYDQLYRRALEQTPIATINWRAQGYASQKDVSGFKNIPGFLTFYSGYTLEDVAIG